LIGDDIDRRKIDAGSYSQGIYIVTM